MNKNKNIHNSIIKEITGLKVKIQVVQTITGKSILEIQSGTKSIIWLDKKNADLFSNMIQSVKAEI